MYQQPKQHTHSAHSQAPAPSQACCQSNSSSTCVQATRNKTHRTVQHQAPCSVSGGHLHRQSPRMPSCYHGTTQYSEWRCGAYHRRLYRQAGLHHALNNSKRWFGVRATGAGSCCHLLADCACSLLLRVVHPSCAGKRHPAATRRQATTRLPTHPAACTHCMKTQCRSRARMPYTLKPQSRLHTDKCSAQSAQPAGQRAAVRSDPQAPPPPPRNTPC